MASLGYIVLLAMEARDLQFVKLNIKESNEVLKHVSTLCHEFGGLFICERLVHVLIWSFKVREQKYEDFFGIS